MLDTIIKEYPEYFEYKQNISEKYKKNNIITYIIDNKTWKIIIK